MDETKRKIHNLFLKEESIDEPIMKWESKVKKNWAGKRRTFTERSNNRIEDETIEQIISERIRNEDNYVNVSRKNSTAEQLHVKAGFPA